MDIQLKLVTIFMDLLLPLMVGYFLLHKNYLSEDICDKMISFNIRVIGTGLSILSFWNLPLRWELIWLPFFGILLSVIPGIAAYLIAGHKYVSGLDKGSYLGAAMLSNIGIIGGICVYLLFGEAAYAYTQIVAMFQNLVFFLFCFPLAAYYWQQSSRSVSNEKMTFTAMFMNWNQLPVFGLIIGMLLYLGDVPRPAFCSIVFDPLVHIGAWTALLPAGYSIKFSAMKQYYSTILDLIPIKFVITPLLAYLVARELFTDKTVMDSILILASAPTGINAIVLARLYNLNLHVASAAFILTTAIFLMLIYPLLFFWITSMGAWGL